MYICVSVRRHLEQKKTRKREKQRPRGKVRHVCTEKDLGEGRGTLRDLNRDVPKDIRLFQVLNMKRAHKKVDCCLASGVDISLHLYSLQLCNTHF